MRLEGARHQVAKTKTPGNFSECSWFLPPVVRKNQVQVITPLVLLHVFADCECVAVPLHDAGGPATAVATIVTFCEGVKPCSGAAEVAVPEKYAPWLSAAYCSSYVATLRRSDFIAAT